jgi:hypothetical protein
MHRSPQDGGALLLSAGLMVVVVGWLVGAGASCCMVVGVLEVWVRPCLSSMPGQRWRRLRPSFTFLEALLHCCRTPLVQIWFDGAALGETLDPCDRTMATPWCRITPWGLRLWSWTSQAGLVEGEEFALRLVWQQWWCQTMSEMWLWLW